MFLVIPVWRSDPVNTGAGIPDGSVTGKTPVAGIPTVTTLPLIEQLVFSLYPSTNCVGTDKSWLVALKRHPTSKVFEYRFLRNEATTPNE